MHSFDLLKVSDILVHHLCTQNHMVHSSSSSFTHFLAEIEKLIRFCQNYY
jgi:hypothetical protein